MGEGGSWERRPLPSVCSDHCAKKTQVTDPSQAQRADVQHESAELIQHHPCCSSSGSEELILVYKTNYVPRGVPGDQMSLGFFLGSRMQ